MKFAIFLGILGVGALGTLARGQVVNPSYWHGGFSPPYAYVNEVGTAASANLRGMGALVRSQGQFNLDTSMAAINVTEARQRQMDNYKKWTDTYFQVREMNRRYRAAERGPRPTMEDLVRFAQAGRPDRLSPSELDPISGEIYWPILLRADAFASERAALQQAFANRAERGAISTEEFAVIDATTEKLKQELREEIGGLPPNQYLAAKRFLESLAFEAGQPVR